MLPFEMDSEAKCGDFQFIFANMKYFLRAVDHTEEGYKDVDSFEFLKVAKYS